jgi:hypothetical protein
MVYFTVPICNSCHSMVFAKDLTGGDEIGRLEYSKHAPRLVDAEMVFKIARVELHYIILQLISLKSKT